jgi:hypothetical protein
MVWFVYVCGSVYDVCVWLRMLCVCVSSRAPAVGRDHVGGPHLLQEACTSGETGASSLCRGCVDLRAGLWQAVFYDFRAQDQQSKGEAEVEQQSSVRPRTLHSVYPGGSELPFLRAGQISLPIFLSLGDVLEVKPRASITCGQSYD